MCRDCGCGEDHRSGPDHDHTHAHRKLDLHEPLLAHNDRQAAENRELFASKRLLVLNLLSAPGSGKTRLLERTLTDLAPRWRFGVIVGDLQTDNDARRLRGRGAPVVPITTGTVCHLESTMVARAMRQLDLDALDVLVIENVGNLVCPASFDLGEELRVVILSTTEGEDKPLKYPLAFKTAHAVLLNKIDLAEAAGFDADTALTNIRRIAPQAAVITVSAQTGQGMEVWYRFLEQRLADRAVSKSAEVARR
jgi:hydrogenase nickel incorporation protein HypB